MDTAPGPTGKTGPRGRPGTSSPYSRRNALILYVFTATLFLVLIIRGEIRDERLANVQHDVTRIQTTTSNKVLCPLYGLLVEQITRLTPQQRHKPRIHEQIVVIRHGYRALNCAAVLPHTPEPTPPTTSPTP